MSGLLDRLPDRHRRLLRPAPEHPGPPMLAVLSDRRSFSDAWLFERKLDGVRLLAERYGDEARLLSRNGERRDDTYPEIVEALAGQRRQDFTVDGELVALRGGRTDFALLQQRMGISRPRAARASGIAVLYYVFDLLSLDGTDIRRLPLRVRKSLLRDALDFRPPLRFTVHRNRNGQDLLADACARGWEGLIAKRADAAYVPRRSPDWLKLKCAQGQELVIAGFTEASGSRAGFGSLLLGYYEDDRLRYAGKVGTGFDHRTLRTLRERLDGLRRERSPFSDSVRERGARWVRPELVAEVGFTEWTTAGRLRHPRYLGLRDDRAARDVRRERPTGRTR
ncbi:non-homologous end-joining DNA ligase [Streptomyces sp. JJ38]|uniref:non-homologous end-joining DNA ligase n=1 Tax=Streptomyces sp. JJ38 TaxID=2738128 RepID=UPI001C56883D|nr:non-homologous end-joining DNA ligase [Streptomyces sp. JJ38]MBW1599768.1 ATP-dependent DNA ligase [Streptomyces sp. JJ38]